MVTASLWDGFQMVFRGFHGCSNDRAGYLGRLSANHGLVAGGILSVTSSMTLQRQRITASDCRRLHLLVN